MFPCSIKPFTNQLNLLLWRLDSALGLLLKRVKYVHRIREPNRIDAVKSISGVFFHNLQDTGTRESIQRLCIRVFTSDLSEV